MSLRIEDIDRLMTRHGAILYGGEAVSQLNHAFKPRTWHNRPMSQRPWLWLLRCTIWGI
jgi:predicted HD phosphohydrolase